MSAHTGPSVAGIHHLSLTVTDLEASLNWYQRLLGAVRMPTKFEHHDVEDTGYGVLLIDSKSGVTLGLHTNTCNSGEKFDEGRTGLDHVSFTVPTRADLESWTAWLDELGIKHSGIRDLREPFPFSTVVFRDPDNIQLELITIG